MYVPNTYSGGGSFTTVLLGFSKGPITIWSYTALTTAYGVILNITTCSSLAFG